MSPPSERSLRRPVIGLSTYEAKAAYGVWHQRAALLPTDYVRQLAVAGAVPVLLPPVPEVIAGALERLDGLVLTGGPDVDPARYGQPPFERTGRPQTHRDEAELALFAAATERDLPVLGICRGLQLINVARGGTLVQHLPDVVGSTAHDPGGDGFGLVEVQVTAGSKLAVALHRTELEAHCHHHQAIDKLGEGLEIVARSRTDSTVEAVEDPSKRFALAVQWHPEVGDELKLFEALVDAARRPVSNQE